MKKRYLFILFILSPAFLLSSNGYDFDKVVSSMQESYSRVQNYKCTMSKKEKVGKDYIVENNTIYKHMKPDCYYLKVTEGFYSGMEALYAGKKYNYQLIVHLGGVMNVKNMKLDPKSSTAMKRNRHSILESDLGAMINLIAGNYYKAKAAKEGSFSFEGERKLAGRNVLVFKVSFPHGKGYYGKQIEACIDKDYKLPVKLTVWGWDGNLLEMYHLTNLKLNCGLTAKDFDEKNTEYKF